MKNKKILIIIIVLAVAALAALGYFFLVPGSSLSPSKSDLAEMTEVPEVDFLAQQAEN